MSAGASSRFEQPNQGGHIPPSLHKICFTPPVVASTCLHGHGRRAHPVTQIIPRRQRNDEVLAGASIGEHNTRHNNGLPSACARWKQPRAWTPNGAYNSTSESATKKIFPLNEWIGITFIGEEGVISSTKKFLTEQRPQGAFKWWYPTN